MRDTSETLVTTYFSCTLRIFTDVVPNGPLLVQAVLVDLEPGTMDSVRWDDTTLYLPQWKLAFALRALCLFKCKKFSVKGKITFTFLSPCNFVGLTLTRYRVCFWSNAGKNLSREIVRSLTFQGGTGNYKIESLQMYFQFAVLVYFLLMFISWAIFRFKARNFRYPITSWAAFSWRIYACNVTLPSTQLK